MIPYFKQERNNTCGVAALRMILGYFGEENTEKALVKQLKLHSFGTFSTDLGILAIKKGYQATTYTFHLPLLGSQNLSDGTVITQKLLKSITVSPHDKMTFESWVKYLESGGKLIWQKPSLDLINPKTPALVSVNTAVLNRYWKRWDNGHYLVVSGKDQKNIFVLDPDPSDAKQSYKIPNHQFLTSWIVNSINSSDYLLLLEK